MNVKDAVVHLVDGHSLSQEEAAGAMRDIAEGLATPAQVAALMVALRMKGETAEEVGRLRSDHARVRHASRRRVMMSSTWLAPAVTVLGHSISPLSPRSWLRHSAVRWRNMATAVLPALVAPRTFLKPGIAIDLPPEGVAQSVKECGFGFMFAPLYHPAMRHVMAPRREIGVRTVLNLLGPISNLPEPAPAHGSRGG